MNLLQTKTFKEFLKETKNNSNIIAVVLFGSYAKGTQKSTSDVDICLITKSYNSTIGLDIPSKEKGFDIIEFHTLPEVTKYRILTQGIILIINDKIEFKQIKRRFLREFMAFTPKREYYYNKLIENI